MKCKVFTILCLMLISDGFAETIVKTPLDYDITCKDENGNGVDWWVERTISLWLSHFGNSFKLIFFLGFICINCRDTLAMLTLRRVDFLCISPQILWHRNGFYQIAPLTIRWASQVIQSHRPISIRPMWKRNDWWSVIMMSRQIRDQIWKRDIWKDSLWPMNRVVSGWFIRCHCFQILPVRTALSP